MEKTDKYALIKLNNGIEVICEDITNVFTKCIDCTTNTVGTHKYKDLVTGAIIYCFVDDGEENCKVIGEWKDFITREEVKSRLLAMTEEYKNNYISKILEAKEQATGMHKNQKKFTKIKK